MILLVFLECQIPLTPPFLKGDLEGLLYEVMRDIISCLRGNLTKLSSMLYSEVD